MGEGWKGWNGGRGARVSGGGGRGGWVVVGCGCGGVGGVVKSQKNLNRSENFLGGGSKKKSIIIMMKLREIYILPKISR